MFVFFSEAPPQEWRSKQKTMAHCLLIVSWSWLYIHAGLADHEKTTFRENDVGVEGVLKSIGGWGEASL